MNDQPQPTSRRFERLPAGRHGLPAEVVANNQRERIVNAVAQIAAEDGYPALTLDEIAGRAAVSRRTFYEHFTSKDEVFLAAYDQAAKVLAGKMQAASDRGETFCERVFNAVEALVDFVLTDPTRAMLCIVEIAAVGPEGIERRNSGLRRFVAMVDGAARDLDEELADRSDLTTLTIVGGINEVFYSRLVRGETDELPALVPDLVYSVLLPFLGHERASAEYRTLLERASLAS